MEPPVLAGGLPKTRWNFFYDRRGGLDTVDSCCASGSVCLLFCTLSSLRETQIYSGMALLCIADFALVRWQLHPSRGREMTGVKGISASNLPLTTLLAGLLPQAVTMTIVSRKHSSTSERCWDLTRYTLNANFHQVFSPGRAFRRKFFNICGRFLVTQYHITFS